MMTSVLIVLLSYVARYEYIQKLWILMVAHTVLLILLMYKIAFLTVSEKSKNEKCFQVVLIFATLASSEKQLSSIILAILK